MRCVREQQAVLTPPPNDYQSHARELEQISRLLDDNEEIARLAHADLTGARSAHRGRGGMSGDQVVRIALLKQIHGLAYRELAFHLEDSAAFQSFARWPVGKRARVSTLQTNVKKLRPETWEAINRVLLRQAAKLRIENGGRVRGDCTVVGSNIHHPTDSGLLWDCIRVLSRVLKRARLLRPDVTFTDHTRRAKRRLFQITYAPKRKGRRGYLRQQYRDLLKVARKAYGYGQSALTKLNDGSLGVGVEPLEAMAIIQQLADLLPAMEQVITQATRRVIHGESVPASEKLVSIFERHTDIIIKDNRETLFGHKVCLTGGKSSLILDCHIEAGNPPDSTLVTRTLKRHVEIFGSPPKQVVFDGGFATRANLQAAKDLGVSDVAFHKRCGLEVTEMVASAWIFKRLRRFRAGIEGCISTLKRAFKMDRCNWRGLEAFKSYVWACVVSFNAVALARHLLA